jgi:glycosyltransferase involved in cell wall biosynthesis
LLPPYRIALYNQIHAIPGIDLDVLLCALKEGDRSWQLNAEKAQFPYTVFPGLDVTLRFLASRSDYYHLHLNPRLIARLNRDEYDAVILSEYAPLTHQAAFWAAKLKRMPVILWYRSFSASSSLLRRLITPYIDTLINHSDALVVPGQKAKGYLLERGAKQNQIFAVGNPVDNRYYQRAYRTYQDVGRDALRQKLNLTGSKVILYVGRLIDMKGLFDLLDAFQVVVAEVPEARLLLVGDGYLEEDLRQTCREKVLPSVEFVGFVQPTDLGKYYLSANVFVLPSHYEPWGLVVNEAMIFGCPVVATSAIGAADEILQHGKTGLIVPPREPEQLAEAILQIVSDKDLADSMGKNAQALIAEHTPERSAQGFAEAIEYAIQDTVMEHR